MGIKHKLIRGFTLIELLIVIAVIGILAGITAIVYNGVQANAHDTSVLSDLDTMDGLQTNYSLKNNGNAKPYYSGNGPDSELDFAPSGGNVIDVVTNGEDYCIRGYNPAGTKKDIYNAFIKESNVGVCDQIGASAEAIANSGGSPPNYFANLTWTQRTSAGLRDWTAVTSSSNGSQLVAADYSTGTGYFYYSTDSGGTWIQRTSAGSHNWYSITASSNGVNLVALDPTTTTVYTSSNSGVSWTTNTGPYIAYSDSSLDGAKLIASRGSNTDYLYTSSNFGTSWTQRTNSGQKIWFGVASSSDGNKLAAAPYYDYIYTSTDSGATWTQRTDAGSRNWRNIASSDDGVMLAAVASGGYIYTSTDSGATWTQRTDAGSRSWNKIVSSSDGTKLAAIEFTGYIYTSTDSGATWTQRTDAGSRNWRDIATSSDGKKLVAVANADYIYTGVYTQ